MRRCRAPRPEARSASFGNHLLDALVPRPKLGVLEMELAVPRVANHPPLVDQDEARPVMDVIRIPRPAVVVLGIWIRDALSAERAGDVGFVVLPSVRWKLGGMDANDRQPPTPVLAIVGDKRRHRARAVATR